MELFDLIKAQFEGVPQSYSMITSILGSIVVFFYASRIALQLAQGIRLYIVAQLKCCQKDLVGCYGRWAVVTGATDGIGLAFAKELASRGMSILVLSRNAHKLRDTKMMLEAIPNVGQVETIQIDMSDVSMENFARVQEQIDPENRDIGLLVNNVGVWSEQPQRFNRYDTEYLIKMGSLNMLSLVHMTRMVMPGMLGRQRGLIINVSSICSSCDLPYSGIYKPTKSFVAALTRQLQLEYWSHPIDIVNLNTGPVRTRDSQAQLGLLARQIVKEPADYVRSALNAATTGSQDLTGALAHGLLVSLISFMSCIGILGCLLRNAPKFIPSPPGNFSPAINRKSESPRVT